MMDKATEERLEEVRSLVAQQKLYLTCEEATDRDSRVAGNREWHFRCGKCAQSIQMVLTDGNSYTFTPEQVMDNFTRHYRQVHENAADK